VKRIETVVIGGGQAGLAMSRCLSERGIEHVVLERGQLAERWRSERWDSLRLLTPNWQSRLPAWSYRGNDPDGFMTAAELVGYFEAYARSFGAPVETGTSVLDVTHGSAGYRVATDRGVWLADSVVVATGWAAQPRVPRMAEALSPRVLPVVPSRYKRPEQLPEGGVLVVGASATGLQLAEEIQGSGRPVTLAVGRHTRIPRRYRGTDIMRWLDAMGVLDEAIDPTSTNRDSYARQPSMQLVGRSDHRTLDLGVVQAQGVRLVGRLLGVEGERVRFADDLAITTRDSDAKLARLLDRVDDFIDEHGLGAGREPRPAPVAAGSAARELDLAAHGIRTVIWATGYRRSYPWLKIPRLVDRDGDLEQTRGVTPLPGLYVLGQRFQGRRNSNFIDGVGRDADELAERIGAELSGPRSRAA
jgi:putative flavoprotein involved in K+ transport